MTGIFWSKFWNWAIFTPKGFSAFQFGKMPVQLSFNKCYEADRRIINKLIKYLVAKRTKDQDGILPDALPDEGHLPVRLDLMREVLLREKFEQVIGHSRS